MAHPVTKRIYKLPEFEFLANSKNFISQNVQFDPNAIVGSIEGISIHPQLFDSLLTIASGSKVGVGSETVFDQGIRSSSEIQLDPEKDVYPQFIQMILPTIQQMSISLIHPRRVELQPYKLVLYQEGDHFEEHMDSEKDEEMIGTLVIEYPGDAIGGNLEFEDFVVEHPPAETLGLTLFYNDLKHSVSKVESGRRIALTFNVLSTSTVIPEVINHYLPTFREGIRQLELKGIKKVGFITTRIYFSQNHLKGIDLLGHDLFLQVSNNVYVRSVAQSAEGIYFSVINRICQYFGDMDVLYSDYTDDQDEIQTEPIEIISTVGYDQIALNLDRENRFVAIDSRFRMGDIVLLKTDGILRLAYRGKEDLYLGNEGFQGEILTNLGAFAQI